MQEQKEHTPPNFKMDTLKIAIFEAGDIHFNQGGHPFLGDIPKYHISRVLSEKSPRFTALPDDPKKVQRTGHMRRRRGTTIRPIDLATSIESIGVVEEKKHTPYAPRMEYLPTFWL